MTLDGIAPDLLSNLVTMAVGDVSQFGAKGLEGFLDMPPHWSLGDEFLLPRRNFKGEFVAAKNHLHCAML